MNIRPTEPETHVSEESKLNVYTVPGQLYRDWKTVIGDVESGVIKPKQTWLVLQWMIEQMGFHYKLLSGGLRELHSERRKSSLLQARAERSLHTLSQLDNHKNLALVNTALSLPYGEQDNVLSQHQNGLIASLWAVQQVGFYSGLVNESLQETHAQLKKTSISQAIPERSWSLFSWWSGKLVRETLEAQLHEAKRCDSQIDSYLQKLQSHKELALKEKTAADQLAACALELAQDTQRLSAEKSFYLGRVQQQENLALKYKQLTDQLVVRTELAALDAIQAQAANSWFIRWLSRG